MTDEIALPTLRASSSASSARFAWIASASACRRRERSVPGVRPQSPSTAARAASTARSTSASPAIAARASVSPVAGSTRSRTSPDAGSVDSPPMKSPYSRSVATATAGIYRPRRRSPFHEPRRRRLEGRHDDITFLEAEPLHRCRRHLADETSHLHARTVADDDERRDRPVDVVERRVVRLLARDRDVPRVDGDLDGSQRLVHGVDDPSVGERRPPSGRLRRVARLRRARSHR